jgi:tRNA threonylcarbamoyl adenosine modification protein YeaZ
MKILALEFSTLRRSAAVLEVFGKLGSRVSSIHDVPPPKRRSGSPFDLLQFLFKDGLTIESIGGVVVGLGPGSYTGIRSSLAIAQGLHLARGILAAGVSSADAIAYEVWQSEVRGPLEVVIDAQRNEVYSATYELDQPEFREIEALKILTQPKATTLMAGPDFKLASLPATMADPNRLEIFPTAQAVGMLALIRGLEFIPPEKLEPIYLREPSFVKAPAIRHA